MTDGWWNTGRFRKDTDLVVMAGLEPAIHATTGFVEKVSTSPS